MKTSTEYIRNCEAALLVAPIARVETDVQVHKRLGQYHRMFGSKKAMVVTKIDVISRLLMTYLGKPNKNCQDTRGLSKPGGLDPTPEAAKDSRDWSPQGNLQAKKYCGLTISELPPGASQRRP